MPKPYRSFLVALVAKALACSAGRGDPIPAGEKTSAGVQPTEPTDQPAALPTDLPTDPAVPPATTPTADRFGVPMLNPTASGGREWYLPANAEVRSAEWQPESMTIERVADGVFRTSGQVRMNVPSPAGKAWWRDVEMTAYFRYAGSSSGSQSPHWELFGRGERHSSNAVSGTSINGGVPAPAGTITWPGYPFGSASVNPHCLGSSYHGNLYTTGRALFEKEISHTEGYASQRGQTTIAGFDPGRWFGVKFVLRNVQGQERVRMELWIDAAADGRFVKVSETEDAPHAWASSSSSIDGCDAAPFRYAADQVMTWAGPWVTFRSDSVVMEFKWLSVREVGPQV